MNYFCLKNSQNTQFIPEIDDTYFTNDPFKHDLLTNYCRQVSIVSNIIQLHKTCVLMYSLVKIINRYSKDLAQIKNIYLNYNLNIIQKIDVLTT